MSKLECTADKIAIALKKFKGKPVIWQQVAGSVGLNVASKEFKQAIDFLWETERIETQGELVEVKDEKISKVKMVTVLTPCGHKALISKAAYEKEKGETEGWNFWRPLRSVK